MKKEEEEEEENYSKQRWIETKSTEYKCTMRMYVLHHQLGTVRAL